MPDFERITRSLELHADPAKAHYYKGLDRGRWECVIIVAIFAILFVVSKT
jgi:hypothetical protein